MKNAMRFTKGFGERYLKILSSGTGGELELVKNKAKSDFAEAVQNISAQKIKQEILGQRKNVYTDALLEIIEESWSLIDEKISFTSGVQAQQDQEKQLPEKRFPTSISKWLLHLEKQTPEGTPPNLEKVWALVATFSICTDANIKELISDFTTCLGNLSLSWLEETPTSEVGCWVLNLARSFVVHAALRNQNCVAEPLAVYTTLIMLLMHMCPEATRSHFTSELTKKKEVVNDSSSESSDDEESCCQISGVGNQLILQHLGTMTSILLGTQDLVLEFLEKVVYNCLQMHRASFGKDTGQVLARLLKHVFCHRTKSFYSFEDPIMYLRFLGVASELFKFWENQNHQLWKNGLEILSQVQEPENFCEVLQQSFKEEENAEKQYVIQCYQTNIDGSSFRDLFSGPINIPSSFFTMCIDKVRKVYKDQGPDTETSKVPRDSNFQVMQPPDHSEEDNNSTSENEKSEDESNDNKNLSFVIDKRGGSPL
mmetsp:Transcript_18974/g.24513  ORF Transcript_18974/g.24513 Transcript_18974/m.24513 type:complete len:483 (-) Transcript_18974:111-1559(-)